MASSSSRASRSGQNAAPCASIASASAGGGKRELIAAARGRAGDDADGAQAGMRARILDGVAGLIGEFAEVDLVGMRRAGEHADIGACTEDPRLAGAQQDHPDFRMLESD